MYQNDKMHREDGPCFVADSILVWLQNDKKHRIGGFAKFNIFRDEYNLYIENEHCLSALDYLRKCKEWLLKNESAHDAILMFEKLEYSYELGHFHEKNWKNGKFLKS